MKGFFFRFRFLRLRIVLVACVVTCAGGAFAQFPSLKGPLKELGIVREALRDSLWGIADAHAKAAENESATRTQARLAEIEVLVKSQTKNGKVEKGIAEKVLAKLDLWTEEEDDERFRYWRAWAFVELGKYDEGLKALEKPFSNAVTKMLALRLKARAFQGMGDAQVADRAYSQIAQGATDAVVRVENCVEHARFRIQQGDRAGALKLVSQKDAVLEHSPEVQALRADLIENSKPDVAAEIRQNILAMNPREDVRLHVGLKLGLYEVGESNRVEIGEKRIRELVRAHPDADISHVAQLRMGDILRAGGYHEKAIRAYGTFLEAYPKSSFLMHALEGRGWSLLESGKQAQAVGDFARASQLATNATDRARCLIKEGDALLAENRAADASMVFLNVPAEADETLRMRAQFRAAESSLQMGATEKARALFEVLTHATGSVFSIEAHLQLAELSRAENHLKEARAHYENVISNTAASSPLKARAYAGVGRIRYHEMQFDEAAACFKKAAQLDELHAGRMTFFGILCLYGAGHDAQARKQAETLCSQTPDTLLKCDLLVWIAKYDYNQGAYEQAQKGFEAVTHVTTSTAQVRDALVWAARSAAARGDFSKTVEFISKAITNASDSLPPTAEILSIQGEALMELARFDEATLVLERAQALPGTEAVLRHISELRADTFYAMGADNGARYEAALTLYKNLLTDTQLPDSKKLMLSFKVGRTLEKLRRFDEAADCYYVHVVLAYLAARQKGVWLDSSAQTFFARAAFALTDHYESRGDVRAAIRILNNVIRANVAASAEAKTRKAALKAKGVE